MIDAELARYIRKEVERQMNVILSGVSGNASEQYEDIGQLFPAMPSITQRPVMHPFGLSSAAPDGILQVTARQGEDKGNRLVLGHRDKSKPACAAGEVVLYDANGGKIQLRKAGMEFTKNDVDLIEQLINLVKTILNARTNTVLGPQPLIPLPVNVPAGQDWNAIIQKLTALKGGVSGN